MVQILALDDEPTMLALYQSIFESTEYRLITTTSGWEALEILRSQTVDLLLQDFHRPTLNGVELLQHLQADPALRDIPVLLVTAGSREQRSSQLSIVGLDWDKDIQGYLQKPFIAEDLLFVIGKMLP